MSTFSLLTLDNLDNFNFKGARDSLDLELEVGPTFFVSTDKV